LEETFEQMITLRDIEALSDLTGRIRERRDATGSNCRLFSPKPGFAINSNECEFD
jgi:hypothetical protein